MSASATHGPRAVVRNRWRDAAADLGDDWRPHLPVTVVIPVHGTPATLGPTLASLHAQDYPEQLLEVVVVLDGPDTTWERVGPAPPRTRIERVEAGWGRANACHLGATRSEGEVLLWVDDDIILEPHHVTRQLRWYDRVPDVAVKGAIDFVDDWTESAEATYELLRAGGYDDAVAARRVAGQWTDDYYDRSDDLNLAPPGFFITHTGATSSMSRRMYDEVGGFDPEMRLGEDTELAYRIAQAGGVFVPERTARSAHIGPTHAQTDFDRASAWNHPFYAQRIPVLDRRHSTGRQWVVPKVVARVHATDELAVAARQCIDRLLSGTEEDLVVELVGEWSAMDPGRRRVLDDPATPLHLLREWTRGDARVRLVESSDLCASVFPSPYRLDVPAGWGVGRVTVERMLKALETEELGALRVLVDEGGPTSIDLWRTAALSRASRRFPEESEQTGADRTWGLRWSTADGWGGLSRCVSSSLVPPGVRWRREGGQGRRKAETLAAELAEVRAELRAERGRGWWRRVRARAGRRSEPRSDS